MIVIPVKRNPTKTSGSTWSVTQKSARPIAMRIIRSTNTWQMNQKKNENALSFIDNNLKFNTKIATSSISSVSKGNT